VFSSSSFVAGIWSIGRERVNKHSVRTSIIVCETGVLKSDKRITLLRNFNFIDLSW